MNFETVIQSVVTKIRTLVHRAVDLVKYLWIFFDTLRQEHPVVMQLVLAALIPALGLKSKALITLISAIAGNRSVQA